MTHGRRVFLKRAGAAALGAALPGCATGSKEAAATHGEHPQEVLRVAVEASGGPRAERAFSILRDRIEQRTTLKVVQANEGAQVELAIDGRLAPEAFRLEEAAQAVRIVGGSGMGLIYGVGKFLRSSTYEGGGLRATDWRGTSAPHGTLRGMYFASHFHNWYHQATADEIARYVEDLALWGVNSLMVIFPMINLHDWNDPQAAPAMAMVRQYARAAKELGLQFATGLNNTMFIDAPQEIRATPLPDPTHRRGNSGNPICPSNPAGHKYLMENAQTLFEQLHDVGLDILCHWPYDEGGCACAACQPWGSNGYLKISRDFTELGRRYFPQLKSVLSTWMFDTPEEGEWRGLTDYMAQDGGWIDYILADAHEDFPRFPLENPVPGNRPLLNFPEISMWGNSPWGGMGANPLPGRFQRLWDQVKHKVVGGFPYSEGIYEDLNKVVEAQFYWDPARTAEDTLREYIGYEFGTGVTEEVLELIGHFEVAASRSYEKKPVSPAGPQRALALAEHIHARLPQWGRDNWRWELLHLRAILDHARFGGDGLETPEAESAMLRLIELYHCELETDDPYHHRVRPPLKRAVSRHGNT